MDGDCGRGRSPWLKATTPGLPGTGDSGGVDKAVPGMTVPSLTHQALSSPWGHLTLTRTLQEAEGHGWKSLEPEDKGLGSTRGPDLHNRHGPQGGSGVATPGSKTCLLR